MIDKKEVKDITYRWVEKFVVGFNLCPFAKKTLTLKQLNIEVEETTDGGQLLQRMQTEMNVLLQTEKSETDTTIIVFPNIYQDFEEYLGFTELVEQLIEVLDLESEFQLATFHPNYTFAEVDENEVSNYTNRSPYPMIQILRTESVEQGLMRYDDPSDIYNRNIDFMEEKGLEFIQSFLKEL